MEIKVAKYAGFCFGVKRAVDAAFALSEQNTDAKIYTVGSLIHNRIVNDRLAENGVGIIREEFLDEDLKTADPRSVFVVRTHGVSPRVLEKLRAFTEKNPESRVQDMTCPFVAKIYRIMEKNTSDETFTILIGTDTHPEVVGISGYIRGDFRIFSDFSKLQEAFESDFAQQIGAKQIILASQTTHNLEDYQKCKKFLKNLYTNALFFDTICNVTETRQKEIEILSRECDAMLVIGGRESSNTKKLYDISRENCK